MLTREEIGKYRKAEYAVGPLFINRWSPRAMSGEEVEEEMVMALFEAARWAPSSFNNQPWRFVFARRGTPPWETFCGLLTERNRTWAEKAALLVVVVSKTTFDYNGKPARTHSYDTGAAWENLALQGTAMGLVVHGMQGFSYAAAAEKLGIPEDHQVEAMIAVGRPGRKEDLPRDLQEDEFPAPRKPKACVVTSSMTISFFVCTRSSAIAATNAAPRQTDNSGSALAQGQAPVSSSTILRMMGILLEPPIMMLLSISPTRRPAVAMVLFTIERMCTQRGVTISSN